MKQIVVFVATILLGVALAVFVLSYKDRGEELNTVTNTRLDDVVKIFQE